MIFLYIVSASTVLFFLKKIDISIGFFRARVGFAKSKSGCGPSQNQAVVPSQNQAVVQVKIRLWSKSKSGCGPSQNQAVVHDFLTPRICHFKGENQT